MKENYHINLRCATCGSEDHFESNEDKSFIKCTCCNREYPGGIEELQEYNQEAIEEVKEQVKQDVINQIQDSFKKAFKDNKTIKIKI